MVNNLYGEYKFAHAENYDDFLKALGVSLVIRKILVQTKPIEKISRVDDDFIILITSIFKKTELKFQLGDTFIYTDDSMGTNLKYKMELDENNKLIQTCIQSESNNEVIIVREFEEYNMKKTLKIEDIVSSHIYTRNR